ncbi:hypothetical protein UlMin_034293, partial [Ulmus minor]
VTMIINESLRLYPPIATMLRKTSKNIKIGKLHVPANTHFLLPVIAVHHSTEIWGEDADKFNPLRFTEPRKHLASYFPFGLGPRFCVGHNLAMAEAKIVLAMIVQLYCFRVSSTYVHAPMVLVTLQPQRGAQILFRRIAT